MSIFNKINQEALPQHVAIIMDGNGRWAIQRRMPRLQGHRNACLLYTSDAADE